MIVFLSLMDDRFCIDLEIFITLFKDLITGVHIA